MISLISVRLHLLQHTRGTLLVMLLQNTISCDFQPNVRSCSVFLSSLGGTSEIGTKLDCNCSVLRFTLQVHHICETMQPGFCSNILCVIVNYYSLYLIRYTLYIIAM